MLRSLKDLERYTVSASDGDIGKVANFLLDDQRWTIRYLVAETGSFFDGRQVLISPISFREVQEDPHDFHLALTMEKVKNSPSVDTDLPVSRQHEREYHRYYGYPNYWGDSGIWGAGTYPGMLAAGHWDEPSAESVEEVGDVHLRSAKEVRGYHIQGTDDAIGHVDDFIVDDETWEVRYLVVDTSDWWFGTKVLVAPRWATRISWEEKTCFIDLTRDTIRHCPQWDPKGPINREYEERLHDHYGRPVYWDGSTRPVASRELDHSGTPAG